MTHIKIIDFATKDVDEIIQIQTECNLSVWSKQDYLGELERTDSIFKIAQTADEKIVGFAVARLVIGNANASKISFDAAEILNIAVRHSLRHKGIGQMIFDGITGELERKNIFEIWLEVRKSNAGAISFYRKNNFEMQFERKNYYPDPTENACVFRRLLYAEANTSKKLI